MQFKYYKKTDCFVGGPVSWYAAEVCCVTSACDIYSQVNGAALIWIRTMVSQRKYLPTNLQFVARIPFCFDFFISSYALLFRSAAVPQCPIRSIASIIEVQYFQHKYFRLFAEIICYKSFVFSTDLVVNITRLLIKN